LEYANNVWYTKEQETYQEMR